MATDPGQIRAAIEAGDASRLKVCCVDLAATENTRVLDNTDSSGATFLISAVRHNHVPCVEVLLPHGASVHYNNPTRSPTCHGSALHEAVVAGSVHIVSILLQHGASPFMGNMNGDTPFDLAMRAGQTGMVALFSEHALVRLSLTAKCEVFSTGKRRGKYKDCEAMVTPYLLFDPGSSMYRQMKRVYLFQGGGTRARAIITYQAAHVSLQHTRASLTLLDPHGNAIQQPEEDRLLRAQAWYSKMVIPAFVLTTMFGFLILLGMNAAMSSGSGHFLLFSDGRKRLEFVKSYKKIKHPSKANQLDEGLLPGDPHRLYRGLADTPSQTLTSTIYFRPGPTTDEAAYNIFVRLLEGPRNEMMRGVRHGRWHECPPDVRLGASDPLPPTAGGVQILPAPPQNLRTVNKEPVCVVCMARPSEYGLVHADSMHVCLCSTCLLSVQHGQPCPLCRRAVEAITPAKVAPTPPAKRL